jgi:hypothetical protein
MIAVRHSSTPATIPGVVKRGIRPARAREDLPAPMAPTMRRKGVPRSAAS